MGDFWITRSFEKTWKIHFLFLKNILLYYSVSNPLLFGFIRYNGIEFKFPLHFAYECGGNRITKAATFNISTTTQEMNHLKLKLFQTHKKRYKRKSDDIKEMMQESNLKPLPKNWSNSRFDNSNIIIHFIAKTKCTGHRPKIACNQWTRTLWKILTTI